jgi:STE24 endopeptidase
MNVGRLLRSITLTRSFSANAIEVNGRDAKNKEYNQIKQRLALVGMALTIIGGAAFVLSGLPRRISDEVDRLTPNKWARRGIFAILLTVGEALVSLPLSYFSGYVIEHRFGLSNQSRRSWATDHLKGMAVALPFTAFGANLLLEIVERWPRRWWAIVTALSLPFTVLLSQLAPVLLMPIFNRFEPLKDQQLAKRLKQLAADSGVDVASVLQMDMSRQTNKANAFFAGMGRTKRIVLGDTMLEKFTPAQIEVVVAHEIAHQAHRDLWRFVALGTVFTAGLSWIVDVVASRLLRDYGERIHVRSLASKESLPLLSWLLAIIGLGLAPLQNAFSRHIERAADTYALQLTQNPRSFESAMQRLGDMNLSDPSPTKLVKYTMYSHPPIAERIARARRFAKEQK